MTNCDCDSIHVVYNLQCSLFKTTLTMGDKKGPDLGSWSSEFDEEIGESLVSMSLW